MDGAKSAVSHGWQFARPVYTSTLKMPQAPEGQIGRTRLFASFLVFSKMTAPGRGCPVNRSTAHRSPGLACIIHEATCEFGFYVFSYSFCGEFMVDPEMTDCLFDARANSASSHPIPLGAWRATLLRRQGDLFSAIDSGRRILMNNAG